MKVPQTRYKIPSFYGNTDWHVVNREDEDLSIKNPFAIYIGITTEIPDSVLSFTKLQSLWCWRHTFSGITSNRFYSTSEGSNGSTAFTSLNVGVTSTSTYYDVPGGVVLEAYVTSGNQYSTIDKLNLTRIRFSAYNSIYFEPTLSYYPTTNQSAIICKFAVSYVADIPSGLYTVNGRTITWNTSHPTYILLYGKECFAV